MKRDLTTDLKSIQERNNKNELLTRLEMAHQEFLSSTLATNLKRASTPTLSREELTTLLAQIEQPLSVMIREGRLS